MSVAPGMPRNWQRWLLRIAIVFAVTILIAAGAGIGFYLGIFASADGHGALERAARRFRAKIIRIGSVPQLAAGGALAASSDWPLYGGTAHNTRYSALHQVNVETAHRLRIAWLHQAPRPIERQVSVPVVLRGELYYSVAPSTVVAVDGATGELRWQYTHRIGPRLALCCGMINRGVAVTEDLVYLATPDAQLVALDRRSGTLRWEVQVGDPAAGYSMTMAPLVADGKVIVGVAGSEFGVRGFVDAYDAATGARVWRFWTIPSPEEGGWWGRWADTTPDGDPLHRDIARERADSARYPDAWKTGGGGVWMTPSYDATLGLVLFGTGNPAPMIDGATRPGDNLYTVSLVAVDVTTGRLRWYYQLVPHDRGDHDVSTPLVLFDLPVGDSVVPAVAHASKLGWVYVLDRRTGARLLRSQPFVPQQDLFAPPGIEPIASYPLGFGGAQWMPSAYSPQRGLLFVLARHVPTTVQLVPEPGAMEPGGRMPNGGTVHRIRTINDRDDRLSAVSVTTGEIVWQRVEPFSLAASGALATAGDLVFVGEGTKLRAFDAATGAAVWLFELGAPVRGAPITYAVGDRQYVAVAAGATLAAFTLDPAEPLPGAEPEFRSASVGLDHSP